MLFVKPLHFNFTHKAVVHSSHGADESGRGEHFAINAEHKEEAPEDKDLHA